MKRLSMLLVVLGNCRLLNPPRQRLVRLNSSVSSRSKVVWMNRSSASNVVATGSELKQQAADRRGLEKVEATQSMKWLPAHNAELGSRFIEMTTAQFADL